MHDRTGTARSGSGVRIEVGIGILAGIVAFTGCGPRIEVPPLQPADLPRLEAARTDGDEYRIEPGDTLEILFLFHPEMNQQGIVRTDGSVSLPEVGDVHVGGRTVPEVETLIRERTSDRLREPQVEVRIARVADRSVYVLGEVGRPGIVYHRKGLTPLQAVIEAGGFRDTARLDSVILVRGAGDEQRFISRKLDLESVVRDGIEEPAELAPADIVFVPRSRIANAGVWVDQHITQLLPFVRGTSVRFPGMGF